MIRMLKNYHAPKLGASRTGAMHALKQPMRKAQETPARHSAKPAAQS
jgi:hypothetical protein